MYAHIYLGFCKNQIVLSISSGFTPNYLLWPDLSRYKCCSTGLIQHDPRLGILVQQRLKPLVFQKVVPQR